MTSSGLVAEHTQAVRDTRGLTRKSSANYERARPVAALPIIMRYGG